MASQGTVFNIQRFSIHDGPGIRTTVFLKGCSMACFWCHNPEGRHFFPELLYDAQRCIVCGECARVCSRQAHEITDGEHLFHRERCETAGECVQVCYSEALELTGSSMTVSQIMNEVLRDRAFYENSGGGVTLSGGEPALSHGFSFAILKQCKAEGLHTAIETCGNYPWQNLTKLLPVTDLFMMDIKLMDSGKHRQVTRASNKLLLENARRLACTDKALVFRTPIIPGVNDNPEEFRAIVSAVSELIKIRQTHCVDNVPASDIEYELLPFHKLAGDKYRKLDMVYRVSEMQPPTQENMKMLLEIAAEMGVEARSR